MATSSLTTCVECEGKGQFDRPYDTTPEGEPVTRCPWCGGTGQVEVSFAVFGYGWNGDFSFREVYDVVSALDEAKQLCERYMTTERFNDVLENGTPTLQWMEVVGPGVVLGVEEHDGQLEWVEQ